MSNLPKPDKPEQPRKKFGCLKGGSLLLLVFLILLVVLHFTSSSIATNFANQQLPVKLETDSSVKDINVNLLSGRVGLQSLKISQPEGFTGEPLMALEELEVILPLNKALKKNPVVIENVHLQSLDLNLISDTNQVLNITKLGPSNKEEPEDDRPSEIPPVWIKDVLLENIQLTYQNMANKWNLDISDIQIEIENLQIEYDSGKGPALITGKAYFPSDKAKGHLKIIAKVGTITPSKPESVPHIQLALGLTGFDLDLVSPYLSPSPSVAKTAFGGSGFDMNLFIKIASGETSVDQQIAGFFEIKTDRGLTLDDSLGGTLSQPNLPFTSIFKDILGNQFGRVINLGENVAKGGVEAGKTVANTGISAVKGVGKTAGGLAGGILKTAKGVVTLDKDDVVGGMKDATVGTAGNLKDTVTSTAGTVGSGLKGTAGAATGSTDAKTWWSEVEKRSREFEKTAAEWFEKNPFPTTSN